MGTYDSRVKFGLKFPNHWGKMSENFGGGGGLTHTVVYKCSFYFPPRMLLAYVHTLNVLVSLFIPWHMY